MAHGGNAEEKGKAKAKAKAKAETHQGGDITGRL